MRKSALLAAVSAIFISGIFLFSVAILDVENIYLIAFLLLAISFFSVYLIIENFIFRDIKKIHSTVKQQLSTSENPENSRSTYPHLLDALNEDFHRWVKERKDEISRLKKLENYRKEFLGNVSHELKTPVFNIQGYILTLLDGGWEDNNINRKYLQRAEKSVERMIKIIEDLESITQYEAGELQLEMEKFDIALMAKDIIDSIEMKSSEKGIRIVFGKYSDAPVYVYADKFRIRQALLNLVVNSIKYGKENGETKINFRDAGEKVMVEVADNGIGISKEHLPRIFERFYTVDKSRAREAGGTGLGLSIVEHILEAHGQSISVLSTPGVGTVFSFTLKRG